MKEDRIEEEEETYVLPYVFFDGSSCILLTIG
jgi:hypothetical protein